MLKYYINPWIVTRTYFFSQNKNESLSFIENLKTGLYYILKGAISDLWNVIHSVEDLNEVETYAIKNNMQKVLTEFLNELSTLDIIKMQNDCFTTKLNSAKYLKNVISDSSPNFNYFVNKKSILLTKNNVLDSLTLELNYKCNLKCKHCYNPKDKNYKVISFDVAKKIIDESYSEGISTVVLTGGECTLNDDFIKIAKYVKSKYLSLYILTNAQSLYDDKKLFEEVVKLYPSGVQVSLYSMNPENHDNITTVKFSHFKTISVIEKLKERNINVVISCFSMSLNIHEYKSIREYAAKKNIKFVPYCLFINNKENNNSYVKLKSDDIKQFYLNTIDVNNPRNQFIQDNRQICYGGANKLCINPNLDIRPCISFPLILGNYSEVSIRELRKTIIPEFQKKFIKTNLKECFKYDYCKYCYFCVKHSDNQQDYLKKSDSFCEDAKAYYQAYLELSKINNI